MRPSVDRVFPGRIVKHVLVAGAIVGVVTWGGASSLAAQQATPEAIAPASSCTIAPLTLPLFGGTPATAFLGTPEAVNQDALTPVDEETEASVRRGVAEILACLNVGDPKQTYAVFTTGYLARTFGDPAVAYLPAFEQSLDQKPSVTPLSYTIQGFAIDGQEAEGRVVISLTVAAGEDVWADRLVLTQVDGHWLVDGVLS